MDLPKRAPMNPAPNVLLTLNTTIPKKLEKFDPKSKEWQGACGGGGSDVGGEPKGPSAP
jgi:hypothetical protein